MRPVLAIVWIAGSVVGIVQVGAIATIARSCEPDRATKLETEPPVPTARLTAPQRLVSRDAAVHSAVDAAVDAHVGAAVDAPATPVPDYIVVPHSVSPDGKWQVMIPSRDYYEHLAQSWDDGHLCETRVVAVTSEQLLTLMPGPCVFDHQNHSLVSADWSRDSRTLQWFVDGKWGSYNIQLLQLDHDKVVRIVDARSPAVRQVLAAVGRAFPAQYAKTEAGQEGVRGFWVDGFAVDVQPSRGSYYTPASPRDLRYTGVVQWPITFRVDVTSDTKCLQPLADLAGGTMTATVDATGDWTFTRFVPGHQGCGGADSKCTYSDCKEERAR